jgi:hypothetical protein
MGSLDYVRIPVMAVFAGLNPLCRRLLRMRRQRTAVIQS